jgi:glutamate-1-semialdehyde 2,1-aminomutase
LVLGVEPDLAVLAKGMSNGYPMAAVIGVEKYMNVAQETFVSSTFWTERIGPAAALATIKKHLQLGLHKLLAERGELVSRIWTRAATDAGVGIKVSGTPPLPSFSFDHPEAEVLRTWFTQRLLELGYLASPSVYMTYAHTTRLLEDYDQVVTKVFSEIGQLIKKPGNLGQYLKGPVAHSGFSRLA